MPIITVTSRKTRRDRWGVTTGLIIVLAFTVSAVLGDLPRPGSPADSIPPAADETQPQTPTEDAVDTQAKSDDAQARSEPDITSPGPDMGDFPNAAATLKQGRSYVEMAPLTFATEGDTNPAAYLWPYLLRYGVTDNVELRVFGNGLTSTLGDGSTTGWSPPAFDMKVHLWDDKVERFQPASSLEVYVQSDWGSEAFRGGTQASLGLNFDFPISKKTNLEWTVSYTGVQEDLEVWTGSGMADETFNTNQFSFQWAIEQTVTDKFQVFVHGFYNGPVKFQQGSGTVIGTGGFYTLSKRTMLFGSCNAGLDRNVPPLTTQAGVAFAF